MSFAESKYSDLMKEIDEKQVLSPELEEKIKAALNEFDKVFTA